MVVPLASGVTTALRRACAQRWCRIWLASVPDGLAAWLVYVWLPWPPHWCVPVVGRDARVFRSIAVAWHARRVPHLHAGGATIQRVRVHLHASWLFRVSARVPTAHLVGKRARVRSLRHLSRHGRLARTVQVVAAAAVVETPEVAFLEAVEAGDRKALSQLSWSADDAVPAAAPRALQTDTVLTPNVPYSGSAASGSPAYFSVRARAAVSAAVPGKGASRWKWAHFVSGWLTSPVAGSLRAHTFYPTPPRCR